MALTQTRTTAQRPTPPKVPYYTAAVFIPGMLRPFYTTIHALSKRDAQRQARSLREHVSVTVQA
jgi:hypothetical protein